MSKRPRSHDAIRRASFGRAERLRREAGDAPHQKAAPARPDRAPREVDQPKPARARSQERKPTTPQRAQERVERSRDASDRQRQARLKAQTRTVYNRQGERRRDTERRAEQDRKQEALQAKMRRVEDARKRSAQRQQARKRDETRRAFVRATEDRKAQQLADRQKEMQRRAAVEIERDQKRRATDQQAAQRRQTEQVRDHHKVERNSYRVNESTALERHHHAIKGIDRREADRLHDFDGRRQGLAGRLAELVPGRRAENERQRAEIVRGYESERLTKHRDFEAFKERAFAREMKTLRDQALERKALMELHRGERAASARDHADNRPRQIEDRARVMDRAEQVQEQQRDQARAEPVREKTGEPGRPMSYFVHAASGHAREPAAAPRDLNRDEGREMVRPAPAFGRA